MNCGFLFSITSKSFTVKSVTKRPFLSVTVNSTFTCVMPELNFASGWLVSTPAGAGGAAGVCAHNATPRHTGRAREADHATAGKNERIRNYSTLIAGLRLLTDFSSG